MNVENISNNKRIAKNTIVLYLRMIFILFVGLFTSRVVLNTLGINDYGIYNVVGGFVTMFTFLNGAMATATQRFITFDLARGNIDKQKLTFSTAIVIHTFLSLLILLLAETVGLWFVFNELIIPDTRLHAAFWVFQLSVLSCCIAIFILPFNAEIIAHERMSAFAYISVMDVILKLVIVYMLTISSWDRLIVYAVLLFLVQILDASIYIYYCIKKFPEVQFKFAFDRKLFREMNNIAGWSLFGNLAGVGYTQGLNVLLNMFFGPAVNAARAIAVTVQSVVSGFISNFQMAVNPQITKSYAINDLERMHSLIFASSKYSFFLLFLLVLPIALGAKEILTFWLKLVPEYSIIFLQLTLCIMLVEALANPLMVSSQATGRVKVYQIVVGGFLLLIVPAAYVVLKLGGSPEFVFIVHVIFAIIAQVFRVIIVGKMIKLSFGCYFKKVILRVCLVFIFSALPSYFIDQLLIESFLSLIIVTLSSIVLTLISIWVVGLTSNERLLVFSKVKSIFNSRFCHA